MESRFDSQAEAELRARHGSAHGEDLASRRYTARLLASALGPGRGGLGCSLKARARDAFGLELGVLHLHEGELGPPGLEPSSFAACELASLVRAATLDGALEPALEAELARSRRDPDGVRPSSAALWHAQLPAAFVDHCQADVVLAILVQEDAEASARRVWGDELSFVPYTRSGALLARRVAETFRRHVAERGREPSLLVLERLGIATWGATARECYERTVQAVTRAEQHVVPALPEAAFAEPLADSDGPRRTMALALRGALARASGRHVIAHWRATPELVRFSLAAAELGPERCAAATPAQVIHAGRLPLVARHEYGEASELIAARLDAELAGYARTHDAYLARGAELRGRRPERGAPWPRVVLVPGLGALCLAPSLREAWATADAYEHGVAVAERARALGRYAPLPELDAFEAECGAAPPAAGPPARLAGLVALVTGAASGIGLATAKAMLAAGAHVVMADRDERVLECVAEGPREAHAGRVVTVCCDVADGRSGFEAVRAACEAFGGVDILVSNAGVAPSGALHTDGGEEALRRSLEVNLLGHQHFARAVADALLVQRAGGALLFNASKAAFHHAPGLGPYSVPKAALLALMRQYAVDLGHEGIRSNAVNADRVRTGLFATGALATQTRARGVSPSEYFRANLLTRETSSEDVAEAFVYLATAHATTGCVLTVDGGNAAAFPR
ncbi:MAG: SDR family oxidoreductase [Polyangiaceae bacterium]|nr:SDR family oxidoreductase [Polyangiaceae bacterium]